MDKNSADSLLRDEGSTGNSLQMEFESAIGSDDLSEISGELPPPLDVNASDTVEKSDVSLMNDDTEIDDRSTTEFGPAIRSDDQNHRPTEMLVSLQDKVKHFMKYGQLDTIEDEFGSGMDIDVKNEGESSTSENLVRDELVFQSEMERRHLGVNNINLGLNGTLMASTLPASDPTRYNLSAQGQTHVDLNKDINKSVQVIKVENEDEIDRLKRMLHQKELELSQLKEEIEKEKQALLLLQTKAENEISKAQKLISEKDAELHAAEESLSGLVEAKIQYFGDGQTVEVAGNFNGWHQKIKLEPQLSSPMLEAIESRKSRLWSTTLWLYPGVYEIKFIVDGQWKIDPQRESTSKGGIENNILRVDR